VVNESRVLDSSYGSTQTPPVAEKLMVVERSFARRLGSATALTEAVPPDSGVIVRKSFFIILLLMIETKLFMLLTSIIADLGSYKYAPNKLSGAHL
jgi:hypothetical protein